MFLLKYLKEQIFKRGTKTEYMVQVEHQYYENITTLLRKNE